MLREHLDEQRLTLDDELDRLLEELGEARHVHALLVGCEVDRAIDDRRHHGLRVAAADRTAFCTPVTPARRGASAISGDDA